MTDPISDMLTRIRNAQLVGKASVVVPYSALLWNIAKLLQEEGYVKKVTKRGRKDKRFVEFDVLYDEHKKPAIHGIKRVSRPGRRMYQKTRLLRPVKSDIGISVLSTSKGLMTNRKAVREGLGGEVMFEIW
ncbi:MAG: 30S ribosomal protein S8 [Candidatus Ryanbacteria bacterium RIFCSPHIGHO2_02_FULL_45_43]|uniref:Small ribosomal subunit protein uS8 n=1 Tax=Candidatus Ryanbacteria bacterium RIFCSPHIGHO2_01_45_13 TaxID=1802112 RepID=A0A1G2FXW7_9BACT|nr:MAG: 30S ribosomal protein S8 [Candidatus Ryanbacteria bacterium RIFCSPHIGHO2_01_FULL_44_130]OGZ42460.1 MAG: 30S ribosomal protein S8 [Candidatus Ryanbacteria bacterium RIFCSPHIGHO2_01_45_13]OGZ48477.1 MAG: 30S ribosomal protein S8 [Candidatus Ryanbacteria bacterium RIFCSPHIGHO2_02_FULL_45_43]OGZ50342.1 MAG: 30S ribosomal protein S8 [Candidatus Ryanbacteria bacterium RIFCSPHIGHO2_12_FULL_44_20]OGZ51681.1 MAG: 30S ribosomal protein S8 [Candidatus Ryanbacteria bacterium RIFCSPLOWO2_01_FULL_44_